MNDARPDLYTSIHKGIRAMLNHLVERSSRTSFTDVDQVTALVLEVDDIFELLASHAHTENRFVHPLLASTAPSVLEQLEHAHEDQEFTLPQLRGLLTLAAEGGPQAPARGHRFVLALTRYVAEQLEHMATEEELAMGAIWDAHEDAAILAVHGSIIASIPPAKMFRYMRWTLPALSPEERHGMLMGMQASAPAPAFAAMMDLCRRVLAQDQWDRLPEPLRAAA